MSLEELLDLGRKLVDEGQDFEAIEKAMKATKPDKTDRRLAMEKVDEWLFHKELEKQQKANAIGYLLVGLVLFLFPLYIAYYTYSPDTMKGIIYLWYGIAILGAWVLKEGFKKYRTPFAPPENHGYNPKKFQRF